MDWLSSLRTAIDYMEEHLLQEIGAEDVEIGRASCRERVFRAV